MTRSRQRLALAAVAAVLAGVVAVAMALAGAVAAPAPAAAAAPGQGVGSQLEGENGAVITGGPQDGPFGGPLDGLIVRRQDGSVGLREPRGWVARLGTEVLVVGLSGLIQLASWSVRDEPRPRIVLIR